MKRLNLSDCRWPGDRRSARSGGLVAPIIRTARLSIILHEHVLGRRAFNGRRAERAALPYAEMLFDWLVRTWSYLNWRAALAEAESKANPSTASHRDEASSAIPCVVARLVK